MRFFHTGKRNKSALLPVLKHAINTTTDFVPVAASKTHAYCCRAFWRFGNPQTFHGGNLGEFANAAVLFSAHRKGEKSDHGCGGENEDVSKRGFSGREGFLGQVLQRKPGAFHMLLGKVFTLVVQRETPLIHVPITVGSK